MHTSKFVAKVTNGENIALCNQKSCVCVCVCGGGGLGVVRGEGNSLWALILSSRLGRNGNVYVADYLFTGTVTKTRCNLGGFRLS